MHIYCCACERTMSTTQVSGERVYPHLPSLFLKRFWQCDGCGNFVGTHEKGTQAGQPLGCIPTPQIKKIRMAIHNKLDPIWKCRVMSRTAVYKLMSKCMGHEYHTANLRTVEEANQALEHATQLYAYHVLRVKNESC